MDADRPLASACETAGIFIQGAVQRPSATGDNTVTPGRAEGANAFGTDPTFGTVAITPVGLSGKIDLTRELVDSRFTRRQPDRAIGPHRGLVPPGRDTHLHRAQHRTGGTITGDFAANGAQAASDAPRRRTSHDPARRLLHYAVLRRRKACNAIVGRAALDYLAALLTAEGTIRDDTCLARLFGERSTPPLTTSPPARPTAASRSFGSNDVVNFSPRWRSSGSMNSGPALVTAADLRLPRRRRRASGRRQLDPILRRQRSPRLRSCSGMRTAPHPRPRAPRTRPGVFRQPRFMGIFAPRPPVERWRTDQREPFLVELRG